MTFIFFIHQDSSKTGATLKRVIDKNFNKFEVQTLKTNHTFKARLEQVSFYDKEIFILLADSKDRLNELVSLIELLKDRRIILILPDNLKETQSCAHQFFPRFFTYVNDTYDDLCAVLNKMSNQEKTNNNKRRNQR